MNGKCIKTKTNIHYSQYSGLELCATAAPVFFSVRCSSGSSSSNSSWRSTRTSLWIILGVVLETFSGVHQKFFQIYHQKVFQNFVISVSRVISRIFLEVLLWVPARINLEFSKDCFRNFSQKPLRDSFLQSSRRSFQDFSMIFSKYFTQDFFPKFFKSNFLRIIFPKFQQGIISDILCRLSAEITPRIF